MHMLCAGSARGLSLARCTSLKPSSSRLVAYTSAGYHARHNSSFKPSLTPAEPTPPTARQSRARTATWLFASATLTVVAGLISLRLLAPPPVIRTVQCEERPPVVGNVNDEDSHLPSISQLDPSILDNPNEPMRRRMETYVKLLQYRIVKALGKEEPKETFFIDSWKRKEGGEGISCVLQDGETFEKAGVNISIITGVLPRRAIAQMSADHAGLIKKLGYKLGLEDDQEAEVNGLPFFASGLSLVVHPKNPFAPTVHFNYRYFELTHPKTLLDGSSNPKYDESNPDKPAAWWFGGGCDLTPMYLFNSDATHFHNTIKKAADANDMAFYPTWKKWCDGYFWIPHRGEARGVGGIFFDDLTVEQEAKAQEIHLSDGSKPDKEAEGSKEMLVSNLPHTKESIFRTVRSLGDAFLPSYLPILQSRKTMEYDQTQVDWQAIRRGRYVEFNLVYDRGTKFGLQTPGARFESVLMSLPLRASWRYGHRWSGLGKPTEEDKDSEDGIEEKKIMEVLREPRDWATV